MSNFTSLIAWFEQLRWLDHTLIGVNWTRLGTIEHPARLITIDNLTNVDLLFSLTGVAPVNPAIINPSDHIIIPANSGRVYDVASNTYNTHMTGIFAFPVGTDIFVRSWQEGNPATKGVYMAVLYGDVK